MNVATAIQTRHAVRHFDPSHQMRREEIDQLLSLATRSPTAFNIQNWRFVVVHDPELRKRIRAAAWDQAQVTDASQLVILCADLKAWNKEPIRYWRSAPVFVRDSILPAMYSYYNGLDSVQRDEAMRSCGIAAQTLMLAAKSMGYDSCPMDGFDTEAVGELIHLPEDHAICLFVAIGRAVGEPESPTDKLPLNEVVVQNTF